MPLFLLVPLQIYRSTSNRRISDFEEVDGCALFLSPYSLPPFSILSPVPEVCLSFSSLSELICVYRFNHQLQVSRHTSLFVPVLPTVILLLYTSLFIKNPNWVFLSTQPPSTLVQVPLRLVWTAEPTPKWSSASPSIHPSRDYHKINLPIVWFPSVTLFGEERIPWEGNLLLITHLFSAAEFRYCFHMY